MAISNQVCEAAGGATVGCGICGWGMVGPCIMGTCGTAGGCGACGTFTWYDGGVNWIGDCCGTGVGAGCGVGIPLGRDIMRVYSLGPCGAAGGAGGGVGGAAGIPAEVNEGCGASVPGLPKILVKSPGDEGCDGAAGAAGC